MATATCEPAAATDDALQTLVGRFDHEVIDVPGGRARIRIEVTDGEDLDVEIEMPEARISSPGWRSGPDAVLTADSETWALLSADVRAGMTAFRAGRLQVRKNLHLGVGFLAATSGNQDPERLRFERIRTPSHEFSILRAGAGNAQPLVCIHGLGGTKISFLTTVEALADDRPVIAVDLPGFGDSSKPMRAGYDAPFYAAALLELFDEIGIERGHMAGNSMGGRIAIEMGMAAPDRVGKMTLLAPALAWLKERPWKWLLQMPLPRLGYLQPSPRWAVEPIVRRVVPGGNRGWTAAGVDEFLRAYLTPSGRYAFYECARNIYMDEPYGIEGFWTRLKKLEPDALFIWGKEDSFAPVSFMPHVERALLRSRHLELDCGHVPQLERPDETHAAMREFLSS